VNGIHPPDIGDIIFLPIPTPPEDVGNVTTRNKSSLSQKKRLGIIGYVSSFK
jgi:hypothetical protein